MRAVLSAVVLFSAISCASVRRSEPATAAPPEVHAQAQHPVLVEAAAEPAKEAAPTVKHDFKGVPPEKSLGWLTNGNIRFIKNHLRKDGQSMKVVEQLASGQHPHAIVLSCSDSRVPPELVFDQKLGEIFTVRTAGESLGANVVGSIEYAVEHLGPRLVVVMGHTSCGAVKAALGTLEGGSAGTPSLDQLVRDIHPRLAAFKGQPATGTLEKESWANARGVASDLLISSKLLAAAEASGQIKIVPAIYDLKTGKVTFNASFTPDIRSPSNH